jgi:hypothetical protein
MRSVPVTAAAAAGIGAGMLLAAPLSPPWLLLIILLGVFIAGLTVRISPESCPLVPLLAGVPFVLVLSVTSLWGGVLAQCGIFGLVLFGDDRSPAAGSYTFLLTVFCIVILAGCIIDVSNHMLLPVVIVAAGFTGLTGVLGAMEYRLKRACR